MLRSRHFILFLFFRFIHKIIPPLPVNIFAQNRFENHSIDDNSPELQLPQPLLQEEDGGQIRTIKYDNNAPQSIRNNPLEVTGRYMSEQELVAVCK